MNGNLSHGASRCVIASDVVGGVAGRVADDVDGDVAEVSGAVSDWVEQVGRFLGVVQAALEQSHPSEDATAEVRAVAGQLPALIRQCRAQVPTPEMIQTWVQTLADSRAPEDSPVARLQALSARCHG